MSLSNLKEHKGTASLCRDLGILVKEHDPEWIFCFLYNPKAAGLVERKNGILKQQIKLLTSNTTLTETTLAGRTKVLSQALIHLNDQPGGLLPHMRHGDPC